LATDVQVSPAYMAVGRTTEEQRRSFVFTQMLLHLQTLRSHRKTAEAFPILACMSVSTSPVLVM